MLMAEGFGLVPTILIVNFLQIKVPLVNESISSPIVLLVLSNGEQKGTLISADSSPDCWSKLTATSDGAHVGETPIEEALSIAKSERMDLVVVAPNAIPPVAKIMDYGKVKYDMRKKKSINKKPQVRLLLWMIAVEVDGCCCFS